MIQTSFNAISTGATGMFGRQVVLYVRHGRLIIAKAPRKRPGKGTAGQERTRAGFQMAANWSQKVRTTPELLAKYKPHVGNGRNVHNLAIADYLVAPEIQDVYIQQDCIYIKATDNLGVESVTVSVYAPSGELLETGLAATGENDTWTYQHQGTAQKGCAIVVTARDLPGNERRFEMKVPVEGNDLVFVSQERVLSRYKVTVLLHNSS